MTSSGLPTHHGVVDGPWPSRSSCGKCWRLGLQNPPESRGSWPVLSGGHCSANVYGCKRMVEGGTKHRCSDDDRLKSRAIAEKIAYESITGTLYISTFFSLHHRVKPRSSTHYVQRFGPLIAGETLDEVSILFYVSFLTSRCPRRCFSPAARS